MDCGKASTRMFYMASGQFVNLRSAHPSCLRRHIRQSCLQLQLFMHLKLHSTSCKDSRVCFCSPGFHTLSELPFTYLPSESPSQPLVVTVIPMRSHCYTAVPAISCYSHTHASPLLHCYARADLTRFLAVSCMLPACLFVTG